MDSRLSYPDSDPYAEGSRCHRGPPLCRAQAPEGCALPERSSPHRSEPHRPIGRSGPAVSPVRRARLAQGARAPPPCSSSSLLGLTWGPEHQQPQELSGAPHVLSCAGSLVCREAQLSLYVSPAGRSSLGSTCKSQGAGLGFGTRPHQCPLLWEELRCSQALSAYTRGRGSSPESLL